MKYTVVTILFCLCMTVQAEIVEYFSSNGELPTSNNIPADSRFALTGNASYASVTNGNLRIYDPSTTQEIKFSRFPEYTSGSSTIACEAEVKVHWANRSGVNFAGQIGFLDNRVVLLAICPDKIGFGREPGASSLFASYSMDTTNAYHRYRIVKADSMVEVYVDNNVNPVIAYPYNQFPSSSGSGSEAPDTFTIRLWQGSNAGRGEAELRYFGYNSEGTVIPEPATFALISLGGLLLKNKKQFS